MELKELIKFIIIRIKLIFLTGVVFGLAGGILNYFLPTKHYATGTLFIRRTIYPYAEDHFTYEGYYSQQAAMFYTNSIIGLIESEDIRSQALTSMNIEVNEKNLRIYDKKIRTAKNGPQLVTLITKEKTSEDAENLWKAMADSTINTMNTINQRGDPFMSIAKVTEKPVLKESFRDPSVFIFVGFSFGTLFSIFYLSFINYFKRPTKK
ncbi:hypothetical protein ACFL0C_01185 [Patescibacteria group bacterium]